MQHRFRIFLVVIPCLALAVACQKSEALVPTVPTPTAVNPADGATLKATAPAAQSPSNNVRLETLDTPTLTAGGSSPTQGGSFAPQYRFQLLNENGTTVLADSGLRSSTSWTPPMTLAIDTKYAWRVRAEYEGDVTAWSALATFVSLNAGFKRGQEVYDPLINGQTVGFAQGGHFVPGPNGGWQADSLKDGLIYDIPTCEACRVEFDVTNFGRGEGRDILKDVKWFSMGDATTWGNFGAFRNHRWKMHLEQRSDGDGTGMQVIWRNGKAGDDDDLYGDHRGKFLSGGPAFGNSWENKVWHFVIEWTGFNYRILVGQLGGQMIQYFPGRAQDSGVFKANKPYAPENHRIELGCSPRGESMVGARYRNVRITPL